LDVILLENKLTGSNYLDWKRNLDIILTAEEYKYILYDTCPMIGKSSTEEERKAEKERKKADEMACY
jgi:hypothetical protein